MKRLIVLVVALSGCAAMADIIWNKSGTPVKQVVCASDGGLLCWRDAGSIGVAQCNSATATEPGCITPSAQSFAGDKTFTGKVITPTIDAGLGAIGTLDLRGNTLTGASTTSTLTIQSNTADGTTSATVPAMNFSLGADITNTDLGWCFTDSAGNRRMCGTEAGNWLFASHSTNAGAAGVSGDLYVDSTGAGGVATGATPGGNGGIRGTSTGSGGDSNGTASGGTGGTHSISTGNGGASSGTATGGAGGVMALVCGSGGAGAAGGGFSLATGSGGAASASWAAGAGGPISFTAGNGGNESTSAAAAGGAVTITAGVGGNAVAGTSGTGGALTLKSGNAGSKGAGAGSFAGTVTIDTGTTSVSSDAAAINIGTTNGGQITIGRAANPHSVILPGTSASGGQPTQIAQLLLTGDVGISLSKSSQVSITAIDFPNILAQTCSDQTQTLANAVDGDPVFCGFPSALNIALSPSCFVSAPGVVTFRLCNVTVGAFNPPSGNFSAVRLR